MLAGLSGDRGAAGYLSTAGDVEMGDCADLASGRDTDEPHTFSNDLMQRGDVGNRAHRGRVPPKD